MRFRLFRSLSLSLSLPLSLSLSLFLRRPHGGSESEWAFERHAAMSTSSGRRRDLASDHGLNISQQVGGACRTDRCPLFRVNSPSSPSASLKRCDVRRCAPD